MGEIAEMMLEGVLCAGCGEWLGGDGDGFPEYCAGCQPDFDDSGMGDFLEDDDTPKPKKKSAPNYLDSVDPLEHLSAWTVSNEGHLLCQGVRIAKISGHRKSRKKVANFILSAVKRATGE